jgi:hypothetical protein
LRGKEKEREKEKKRRKETEKTTRNHEKLLPTTKNRTGNLPSRFFLANVSTMMFSPGTCTTLFKMTFIN